MARHPKPPPSPSPSPPPSDSDPSIGFDPIEEWLVDFDPAAMSSELAAAKALGGPDAEQAEAAVPETAAQESFELEFGVEDEKVEVASSGLDELLLAPDQLLVSGIGDLAVSEDVPEAAVDVEMAAAAAALLSPADAEMNTTVSVEVEAECGKEGKEAPPAPADAEMNATVSVEVEAEGGKEEQESSEEESESESSEDDDDDSSSSEASSSSEEEKEQGANKDEESSEDSSSEEEELGVMRHGGKADNLESLLEEGELMIAGHEEQKGDVKSKYEAEVRPPVPKIEIQLQPHHQTLPVGTISTIMGERVIVEGSVQHNPLNEGSIIWITESRTPLGIVDELFGPVKNPYYLVRYNSEEEVPAGISAGTNVSFVAEFADHILNMKELYAKGYDESDCVDNVDNDDEEEDLPDFSDDEKEAEYKRSLRQAKRQTDRQHEPMIASVDRKRSQPRGSRIRKPMPPRNMDTSTPGHQPKPHFRCSDMAPAGSENTARSMGPQNASMIHPNMLPRGPMNPAMPSPVPLANQMGGCFMNPGQQFLPQQPNMVWSGGFPQPPHPNMGVDGVALAANIMQNLLAGANQFQQLQNQNFSGAGANHFPQQLQNQNFNGAGANHFPQQFQNQNFSGAGANQFQQQFQNQNFNGAGASQFQQQFQNQNFGGFPNQMPMPFPQFMPQTGMPANPMPFSGRPPMNSPFGPAPQVPMGQGNFGQPPNSQGFTNLASPRGDGEQDSPPQFSSRQFHQGRSSFGQGRTQQRGGRHFSGRGGRGGRHRR